MVIPFIVTVALAIAWWGAETRGGSTSRRFFGIIILGWTCLILIAAPMLERFDANAYFTFASKKLLKTSTQQLRAGKTEAVLKALARADDKFQWTYENRGHYREVVDEAVTSMETP